MKILVIGPEWFYPITEFVSQAFQFYKNEVKHIYYQYTPTERKSYYIRKLKQIKLYDSLKNIIESKSDKEIFKINNENILKEVKNNKYDLIFIIRGNYIHSETIKEIKLINHLIKIYIWFVDDPFIMWLGGNNRKLFNESINAIKYFDKIFVFDDYFVDGIKYRFNNETYYLPLAFDEQLYKKKDVNKDYNISFIGSENNERYEYLKILEDFGLVLFGGNWRDLNKYKLGDVIPVEKSNEIYNKSLVNFNLHTNQTVYGSNTRTFEVPGSGNFLITDYRKSLEKNFELDKEIVCYKSKEELLEKIRFLLNNKKCIFEIAAAGYKRAISEHSYKHRIKTVLEAGKF